MKNLYPTTALAILLLLTISCAKENNYIDPNQWWMEKSIGEVSAKFNGEDWGHDAYIIGHDHPVDTLEIQHHPNIDVIVQRGNASLGLTKIPCELGRYKLHSRLLSDFIETSPSAYYLTTEGGDVVLDSYYLDSTQTNYVEITKLTEDKQIYGTFEAHFIRKLRDKDSLRSDLIDTIHLMDGYFHTRLYSKEELK